MAEEEEDEEETPPDVGNPAWLSSLDCSMRLDEDEDKEEDEEDDEGEEAEPERKMAPATLQCGRGPGSGV